MSLRFSLSVLLYAIWKNIKSFSISYNPLCITTHVNRRKVRCNMTEEISEEKTAQETVKEEKTTEALQTKEIGENTVFIGRKPVMNYVIACLTFFNSGSEKVVVKARERSISRAVDSVELLRSAFVKDLRLQSVSIGTEQITSGEGQTRNVSTIEITVTKP